MLFYVKGDLLIALQTNFFNCTSIVMLKVFHTITVIFILKNIFRKALKG